jgi:hypothetical protein
MKNSINILVLIIITTLSGCDNFEKSFYKAIDDGEVKVLKNKNDNIFDLSKITDFKWDSVLVVRGNESVPVTAEQIEFDLKRVTTDRDRFYFLQNDKTIIVKEISTRNRGKSAYDIELCLIDSINHRPWLSRQEAIFRLMTNSRKIGDGTIFLFPPCHTTVIPDSLKIF